MQLMRSLCVLKYRYKVPRLVHLFRSVRAIPCWNVSLSNTIFQLRSLTISWTFIRCRRETVSIQNMYRNYISTNEILWTWIQNISINMINHEVPRTDYWIKDIPRPIPGGFHSSNTYMGVLTIFTKFRTVSVCNVTVVAGKIQLQNQLIKLICGQTFILLLYLRCSSV